ILYFFIFFFSSRRRYTRSYGDWSSDVCSSDLGGAWHSFAVAAVARLRTLADRENSSGDPRATQTMKLQPDFLHEFVPGNSNRTLLLLHGTGGNERDLIPLGRELDPNASLLSPRGKILENGMPRFFRRLAEGVFDLED